MSPWTVYADPGLTVPFNPAAFAQAAGGAPAEAIVYVGSPTPDKKLQLGSAPGVGAVELALEDASAGTGLAVTTFRLALSAGGLDTATPGAALALGTTLLSGVDDEVPVFVRVDVGAAGIGVYTDLNFAILGVIESDA